MNERLVIALLLAAVALAYGNSLVNQFTLDDGLYILRNPQVTSPSLLSLFSPNSFSKVFRPVTFATFALNWTLNGAAPFAYHLLNLVLHAGVTCVLYLLLRELLECFAQGKMIAFAAALMYAVHPIHAEAVTSIVGRSELLAAGFLLFGWLLHLRDRPIASLCCFGLAVLSKESAAAFLPLILLGDYVTDKRKPVIRYLLAAGLLVLYLGLFWKVEGGRFGSAAISVIDNPLAGLPPAWRILNALRIGWKYVALQIFPAALSCDYSFNQIPVFRDLRHTLPAALAGAAVVSAWAVALWKRKTGLALAGAIYFSGFAVTANILVPTGTILGERLAYLPSAGFCLLVALGWNFLRRRQSRLAWGFLVAVVAALTIRTVVRNRDWKDNFALYSSAVRAVPNDAKMHTNLAGEYMVRNQLDLAAHEYEVALTINPEFPDALAFASVLAIRRENYPAAGKMLEKALSMSGRNDPNYDLMIMNYATVLMKTNHAEAALGLLNREIEEMPGYASAWSNRAELHFETGNFASAKADAETALRLDPQDEQALDVLRRLSASTPATAPQ